MVSTIRGVPSETTRDSADEIEIRVATADDTAAILDVCSSALGWTDPEFDSALFRWKHLDNAFGPSLILVATESGTIAGVRPLMRWRFANNNQNVSAARAVDTATHPTYQGRGLFRRLTEAGLEHLRADGTGFVFNTPNDKSLPGYLKMGWVNAGQVPVGIQARSPLSIPRLVRSRVAAEKRSIKTPHLGEPADSGLNNIASVPAPSTPFLETEHSPETLRWRYAGGPISYRLLPLQKSNAGVIVRLRNRGSSRELVVAETIGSCDRTELSNVIRSAMKQTRADYCLTAASFPRSLTIPRLGPTLALRTVNYEPDASTFAWNPGDIELF